ncbi:RNA helicase [Orbilia oligospora]|uniref:RNA helicase n=1 Tax=Orbilia oligospora TaxID=2813651 RepID=A0A6G1M1N1_ORBOL|nr:RNA helicase [Orbilia oligospora]KAF3241058.1 RNA helicase [Orbilia oligospora]
MRRAVSGLATRSQPSVCLLCRISQPTRRYFSSTPSRLRVATKGNSKGPPIKYRHSDNDAVIGPLPYFLKPNSWRPTARPVEEERPWSIGLLKERLGIVFKRNPEDPNVRITWGEEATEMRKADPEKFKTLFREYVESIRLAVGLASPPPPDTPAKVLQAVKDVEGFKKMYSQGGISALDVALMDTFIMQKYDTSNCVSAQRNLANFSHPAEWYPKTRTMKRTWHLHVGPTNSGKTYNALKKLEEAKKGIYCGPLRLLAHEVYSRLNAKGIRCNLRTGEEKRVTEDVGLWAATVEMAQLETQLDVAVVDEIQMLSDPERGWAWTQAVLGLMAKELHLCGEERAVGIVEKLARLCGDDLVIHRYQRLGKLQVMNESLNGDFSKIEKGDCIVGFSRKDIHTLKRFVEQVTGLKCAIVYGALPAETRATQAKYFNDPKNDYDVLVASDAIGLGLNLSIKRVIFSTMFKFNGQENVEISIPLTRQIAGRAGRYRSAADDAKKTPDPAPALATKVENKESWDPTIDVGVAPPKPPTSESKGPPLDSKIGYATTFVKRDLEILRNNMETEAPEIEQAIVLPSNSVFENYCALFKAGTPFHEMLSKIASQASVDSLFKFTNIKPMIEVARLLEPTESEKSEGEVALLKLSDLEKILLSSAPVKINVESCVKAFREFAKLIAQGKRSTLLTISRDVVDIEALDIEAQDPAMMIKRLEELHTVIMLYAWCSLRFRHVLTGHTIVGELKHATEKKIDEAMKKLDTIKNVVLRKPFREDARRGKSMDLSTIHRGSNVQMHHRITAAPRTRDSDKVKRQFKGSQLLKPAHATTS